MSELLQTDYLVIGSGLVGMAFVDTLLTETDAHIIIVDRYAKPGGHWNVAYPFVTLHQPSSYFGVSSKELSQGEIDQIGLNKGMGDLASGAEVCAYFDDVMRQRFLASGRVQYFPMCDYVGDGEFKSKLTDKTYTVRYRKLVDATFLAIDVPSTHTPNFRVVSAAQFMPLNNLPKISKKPAGYVVIGGGKTGIDACLWLLEIGVDPQDITWIRSRDAWLLDRANTQPTAGFFSSSVGSIAAQYESIGSAESIENMFDRLEESGYFLRLDKTVRPTMFHAATISKAEVVQLQRIKNVVRMGHVKAIEANRIVLTEGIIATTVDHIHVDCSASLERSFGHKEPSPIFEKDRIMPQMVRAYQPAFSASMVAYVEANYDTEAEKNRLCGLVPTPNQDVDFIPMTLAMMMNQFNWSQDNALRKWIKNNRLDGFTKLIANVDKADHEKMAVLSRIQQNASSTMGRLQQFNVELAERSKK
ncbi:MAG: NAD(P)/FAD-dependent oxidoreductase [Porticoccaceae bacterium]|nr:NAD(P)/FAD-dependent oxidoreductase [Porticoccaceae bacterium]MDG1474775.1 NAD(P)/FAD-dependent oxidoreductase [Porticoccaceae bacterium]